MRRSIIWVDGNEFLSTTICLKKIHERIGCFSKPTFLRFLNSLGEKSIVLKNPTFRTPGNIWYLSEPAIAEIVDILLRPGSGAPRLAEGEKVIYSTGRHTRPRRPFCRSPKLRSYRPGKYQSSARPSS